MRLYRWLATTGLFCGAVTAVIVVRAILDMPARGEKAEIIFFVFSSIVGIATSVIASILHPSNPESGNPIDSRITAFVGIGLNLWPWMLVAVSPGLH